MQSIKGRKLSSILGEVGGEGGSGEAVFRFERAGCSGRVRGVDPRERRIAWCQEIGEASSGKEKRHRPTSLYSLRS